VRETTREKLHKAHAKHIGKTGQVSKFVEFLDEVVEAGLKALGLIKSD
jgi:hypothetical protein